MGNDRKPTPDVAKSRPGAALAIAAANLVPDHVTVSNDRDEGIDAGAAVGGSSQGQPGPGDPIDFCERVHELRFRCLSGATPHVGQPVRLVLASPPHVVSTTGEDIGELTDRRYSAIQNCLMDDWMLAGHIVELSPDRKYGKVRVAGRRA